MSLTPIHESSAPVFVVGYKRSGTSLTCRLLLDHLGVSFGSESQFIVRYHRRLASYGDLRDDRNLIRLMEDISRERFFVRTGRNFGFVWDREATRASIRERKYAAVLQSIFGQLAASRGLTRWGDKTPGYSLHLPVIHGLFPDAQFVHVVRDVRDVAASVFKTGFGPKDPFGVAVEWNKTVAAVRAFSATMPTSQCLEFRYEDLLHDPAAVVGRLASFLRLRNGREVSEHVAEAVRVQVRPDNSSKWKQQLTAREIDCLETFAGERLRELNYELVSGGPARQPSQTEIMVWRLKGLAQRLVDTRYWSDNWYKLRLRAQDAGIARSRESVRLRQNAEEP